jgi:hypothetical protein
VNASFGVSGSGQNIAPPWRAVDFESTSNASVTLVGIN